MKKASMKLLQERIIMKFIKNIKSTTLVIFFGVFTLPNSYAQNVIVDKIVGKVSDYIILQSDVEKALMQVGDDRKLLGDKPRCAIFEQLIINKLMMAKAEIDSVIVEQSMVEGEMDRRMQYFLSQFGSREKMEQTLGKTVPELRDELREQIQEQLTVQRMQMEVTSEVSVTPLQVKRFFNTIPKDSIPFLSAEVEVGQIVKYPGVSKVEDQKTKNKLLSLKHEVLNGSDFAKLARQHSEDYGSASKGGDLGWHGRGELVPEFEEVALSIEPGEIADPIKSEFGYHLIQLQERRGNQFKARHILMRPKSTADDLEQAKIQLDSIRTLILADSMTFNTAVKEYSDDQATRENAGYFKDANTGSSLVSTDNLDPVVFFTIDTMSIGNISNPLPFRSEDGKEAARILYYKSYKPPHYASVKEDYQKLYVMTVSANKNKALNAWIEKAVKEVYIDVDDSFSECDIIQKLQ